MIAIVIRVASIANTITPMIMPGREGEKRGREGGREGGSVREKGRE